jgi:hypothetical protein
MVTARGPEHQGSARCGCEHAPVISERLDASVDVGLVLVEDGLDVGALVVHLRQARVEDGIERLELGDDALRPQPLVGEQITLHAGDT